MEAVAVEAVAVAAERNYQRDYLLEAVVDPNHQKHY